MAKIKKTQIAKILYEVEFISSITKEVGIGKFFAKNDKEFNAAFRGHFLNPILIQVLKKTNYLK